MSDQQEDDDHPNLMTRVRSLGKTTLFSRLRGEATGLVDFDAKEHPFIPRSIAAEHSVRLGDGTRVLPKRQLRLRQRYPSHLDDILHNDVIALTPHPLIGSAIGPMLIVTALIGVMIPLSMFWAAFDSAGVSVTVALVVAFIGMTVGTWVAYLAWWSRAPYLKDLEFEIRSGVLAAEGKSFESQSIDSPVIDFPGRGLVSYVFRLLNVGNVSFVVMASARDALAFQSRSVRVSVDGDHTVVTLRRFGGIREIYSLLSQLQKRFEKLTTENAIEQTQHARTQNQLLEELNQRFEVSSNLAVLTLLERGIDPQLIASTGADPEFLADAARALGKSFDPPGDDYSDTSQFPALDSDPQ